VGTKFVAKNRFHVALQDFDDAENVPLLVGVVSHVHFHCAAHRFAALDKPSRSRAIACDGAFRRFGTRFGDHFQLLLLFLQRILLFTCACWEALQIANHFDSLDGAFLRLLLGLELGVSVVVLLFLREERGVLLALLVILVLLFVGEHPRAILRSLPDQVGHDAFKRGFGAREKKPSEEIAEGAFNARGTSCRMGACQKNAT
jgi:hypothetical protein